MNRLKLMIKADPKERLKSIVIYVEGVKHDFPELTCILDNIMIMSGFDPKTGEWFRE